MTVTADEVLANKTALDNYQRWLGLVEKAQADTSDPVDLKVGGSAAPTVRVIEDEDVERVLALFHRLITRRIARLVEWFENAGVTP